MTTAQEQRAAPDPTQNRKPASVGAAILGWLLGIVSSALFRRRTRPLRV